MKKRDLIAKVLFSIQSILSKQRTKKKVIQVNQIPKCKQNLLKTVGERFKYLAKFW